MDGTDVAIGEMTSAAWREEALARVEGLRFLEQWILDHCDCPRAYGWSIDRHLLQAEIAATGSRSRWRVVRTLGQRGHPEFERALANLDMAENDLLRLADDPVVEGAVPSIEAHVNRHLAKDDPRRVALAELAHPSTVAGNGAGPPAAPSRALAGPHPEVLLNALFAANTQRRRNLARVRNFRDMIAGGIIAATIIALAIGVLGLLWPSALPLCFAPETEGSVTIACPQAATYVGEVPLPAQVNLQNEISDNALPGDRLLIEFLGLVGAAVSVAALLRGMKGTSTPYNVPLYLALLKVPTGAITAVVGLVLMRADFVPGLSALDSPAQILGWAPVFGISQQLVTRNADNRGHDLLEEVGGRGPAGDRQITSRPTA
jgi:hypothetical protein